MALRINIPPLTRALLILLCVLSLLAGALRYSQWARSQLDDSTKHDSPASAILVPYLTIIPQLSLFYPWVFLTATLVEQNVFTLLVTGATLFYGGRYLERAWSSAELAKFLLVVTIGSNLTAVATYVSWYAVTGNLMKLLSVVCGGVALQASFLVAFKQLVPEHTVSIAKGLIKLRIKHFPALFLLCNTVSGFILGTDTALILAWSGFFMSWIFLRFYKLSPSLSSSSTGGSAHVRGDASEAFAFASFFPEPLRAPVAAVSGAVYNALVAVKLCTPFTAEDVEAGNEQAMARGEAGLPSLMNGGGRGVSRGGGKREEAERRRALALKALDQRLHAASTRTSTVPAGSSAASESGSASENQEAKQGRVEGAS